MINVVLWKWRPAPGVHRAYDSGHVNALARSIKNNAAKWPVRIICVTDDPRGITECETYPLWEDCSRLLNASGDHLPSCYRRLRLYDPDTQTDMGIKRGERIIGLDLDTLVCGSLDSVFNKDGVYVGWLLAGTVHDEVYNGSFQMFNAGELRDVWDDFDPDNSPKQANLAGYRGSDQSWLSWKLVGREGCTHIPYPLFASYPLHCRKLGYFSAKTRLVFFHGTRKPWSPETMRESNWVQRYWRPTCST
jgi:hypothetical protein